MTAVPDNDRVKDLVIAWARQNPRITKVHLFGSHVTKRKHPPSDIDIAIEISDEPNDSALAFWCCEGDKLENQLSQLLKYPVDLEIFDDETPTIKKGLEAGSILVYQQGKG